MSEYSDSVSKAWVRITLHDLKILVPHQYVASIETSKDMITDNTGSKEAGWFEFRGSLIPVFCMSHTLSILNAVPEQYDSIAVLKHQDQIFGTACNHAKPVIVPEELEVFDIPECMQNEQSPIDSVIRFNDEVNFLVDVDKFLMRMNQPNKEYH